MARTNFYENYRRNKEREEEALDSLGFEKKKEDRHTVDFFQNYLKKNGYEYTTQGQRNNAIKAAKKRSGQVDYEELSASRNEAYQMAIELAKANGNKPKAGDNRTTAIRQPQMVQQGNSLSMNPIAAGNTAATGADVDYTAVNKKATENGKGWRGLFNSKEETITPEESEAHAIEVTSQYTKNKNLDEMLKAYTEAKRMEGVYSQVSQSNPDFIRNNMQTKEKAKQSFQAATGVSDEEFEKIVENYTWLKNKKEAEDNAEEIKSYGTAGKIGLAAATSVMAPYSNVAGLVGALDKPKDKELGRNYNSDIAVLGNTNQAAREAVNEDIETIENPVTQTLAKFGFNAAVMGIESASSALLGEAGLGTYFTAGYTSGLQSAENRGLTEGQSQAYALATGGLEYITERIPWEGIRNIWSGKITKEGVKGSLMPYIKALLKQSGEEAGEEVVNGIGETLADAFIAGDKSNLNLSIQNYMDEEGLSKQEATRKAVWDVVKETGEAAITAGLSAGVSVGPALVGQASAVTKAGKSISKNTEGLQDALNNPDSPNYISPNLEDYASNKEYNEAQVARMNMQQALDNKKLSGKQARNLYESVQQAYQNKKSKAVEQIKEQPKDTLTEESYKLPEKTQEEVLSDIEFASTPYELTKAMEYIDQETDEIKELVNYKKDELKMYGFTEEQIDNAITPKKAYEMGQRGEQVSEEQLNAIPEQDRQEVLEQNNQQFNKAVLREHPDAVVDKATGKYFAPSEVKTDGQQVIVVDSKGNEHTDFTNPKIKAAENAYTIVSKDANTGYNTDQNVYNVTVEQAALATNVAIKSVDATPTQVKTAIGSIFTAGSLGTTTWNDFERRYKFIFDVIDKQAAKNLFDSVRTAARVSDRVKQKNTAGQRTSNETVSKTLRENLPEETVALLESFGKKIGYNFVASTNKDARGEILPSRRQISIGSNNLNEVYAIASHEGIAEYLQAHGNEEEVLEIQDIMLNYLEDKMGTAQFNNLIDTYQAVYRTGAKSEIDKNKSRRAAANEMFADTTWTLFSSEEGLNDFTNWVSENNTASEQVSIFQKIKDFFGQIYNAIKNYIESGSFNGAEQAALEMDANQAKDLRDRIFKAMDHAIENARASEGVQQGESAERKSIQALNDGTLYVQLDNDYMRDEDGNLLSERQAYNRLCDIPYFTYDGEKIYLIKNLPHKEMYKELMQRLPYYKGNVPVRELNSKINRNIIEALIVSKNVPYTQEELDKYKDHTDHTQYNISNFERREVYIVDENNAYKLRMAIASLMDGTKIAYAKSKITEDLEMYKKIKAETTSNSRPNQPLQKDDTTEEGNNATTKPAPKSINVKKLEDTVRHSFAGIHSETADEAAMYNAMHYREEGMDDLTILASTGWFLGMDNKWRYEIPDNDMEIFKSGNRAYVENNPDFARYLALMDKILFSDSTYTQEEYDEMERLDKQISNDEYYKTKQVGKLPDYIKHDELFKAYPWLEFTDVYFVNLDDSTRGAAGVHDNSIVLNSRFQTDVGWSKDMLKSTLIHEIQHLIQADENFENGASPDWWADIKDERIERDKRNIEGAQEHLDKFVNEAKAKGKPASTDEFVNQSIKKVADKSIDYSIEDHWKALRNWKKNSSIYYYENMISKLERHIERLTNDSNEKLYWNTAGEIEARDAADRINYTKEDRLNNYPNQKAKDVVYPKGRINERRFSIKVDSKGRSLSKEQQSFFKNSKVLDQDGNLKVVYHGTMANFTIFDLKEARDTEDIEAFFFSGNYEESEGYGNVGEYYLNITNPADYDTAYDIFFKYKGKEHAGRLAREELQDMGYDGVIAAEEGEEEYTEYLVFNSNQIKRVDNKKPTDNPDVRKSIKVDNQGRNIAPGMQQYLKDNAEVFFDENGAVKNYYHGTRYAGFTKFMLDMMDDKQSIFLTDSKGTANTYAGNHDLFEPDKEWTYRQLENAISYMTGGDWEIDKDGNTITITEYGFGDVEDKETQFDSILAAQTYFIDNFLNKIDLRSDENAAIYNVYVKSSNPLVIDAEGKNWDEITPKDYWHHYVDLNITKDGNTYQWEGANTKAIYTHGSHNSKEEFEKEFGKLLQEVPDEGLYYSDLYLDKDRNEMPSNTRSLAKYAKLHGYDSLVINNVVDTGIFGNNEEKLTPSQVVVVFNPNQVKSVHNQNPSETSDDIRKSIKVDWDKNDITIPARTYEGIDFFEMSDEEIEEAERQDIEVKAYWANIIHSKDFAGLMFSWEETWNNGKKTTEQRYLTPSTREYDWQYSYGRDNEPHGHYNYYEKNDDVTIYGNPWGDDMASLYQELLNDTPKEGIKVHVLRTGAAEDARQSIKVYGEASPYADSLNETKTIQALIGSMNSSLSKADVFEVPNDELIRIERYINNKYKVSGMEEGEIAANVAYAFAYMQKNKLDTDYETMMNYLLNIGDEVIKNSNLKDEESEKLYNDTRAQLQSHKIKLTDEDRAEISNAFGGSWKAAFGALQKAGIKLDNKNGVSIDSIFSEIKQEVLENAGVDISYGDKPSEQILALIDTMTALEPTAYLWDGANDLDKALTVVTDIVEQYYSAATEQLEKNVVKGTKKGKETIKKAVEKEKARLRGEWSKYKYDKTQEFNDVVAEKNRLIQQQQNEIRKQNEMLKTWEKDMAAKDKELSKRTKLTDKEIKATARLQAKQAVQSYKDRQERARQIENIKRTGIRLIKWLTNPTDAQHVPPFLQEPLGEFLGAIDFLPKNPKADAKSTLSWHQRMNALREELIRIKNAEEDGNNDVRAYFANNIVAKELISMMDDFLGKEEWDEYTQSYVLTKRGASKVSNLDAKDLATLNKIMSALSASINNLNKTYANDQFKEISKLSKKSVEEIDKLPAKKDMQKLVGKAFNFLNFDELEPITWFEGLGNGAKSVFQELRDGFDLKTKHVRESDEYMAKAKEDLGISDKELSTWKNQLHKFELLEGTVMLNTTQIMSLYEILKRKQGRPHVAVGGIKAADFEYKDGKYTKKHHQAQAVHIMSSEAQAIIDTLTEEQKALADKMQQYMASECASWGNRVTEKMYGYKKYEEKDYFPLKTDAHSRATTASSDNNVSYYTIKNASFTKPITPMANNAVVLEDIFDVFTDHVVNMADYDAYVMPIADAMRWFNYSERIINATEPDELNEAGARMDYLGNMQESIDRVYGDAGLNYFRQFIKDINGDYAGRGGKSEILSSLMSMYKAQAVGANVRVVIQQPTAVVRAADVIEPKYLMQAMTSLPKAMQYAKKAQANSEIAYWKAQGYYETYLGQSFKEIITGDTTLKDRINDWSGKFAGLADDLSWGIMYHAAELKVKATQPQLKEGTTEFDKAATKIFEDIVDHTQVVDTIFHKSQWMRSQELGHKMTSAFMAEPTKTYNMLYRAYRTAKLSGDKKFAMRKLKDVALIFVFEQMLNAIVTAVWDSLRDDEKEDYLSGLKAHFKENAVDNLNLLKLLPLAKDIFSFFEGYDATSYVYDGMESLVETILADKKYGTNLITGDKQSKTPYGIIYQNAKAVSQMSGIPVANVMRDVKSIYNVINGFWGGEDIVTTTATKEKISKARETNRVSEVFDASDLSAIKSEVQQAYEKGVTNSKDQSESDGWTAARNMLKEQFKRQIAEHPENKAAIVNRYKTLLKYTKESDGKGGYRALTDKEIENSYINKWLDAAE